MGKGAGSQNRAGAHLEWVHVPRRAQHHGQPRGTQSSAPCKEKKRGEEEGGRSQEINVLSVGSGEPRAARSASKDPPCTCQPCLHLRGHTTPPPHRTMGLQTSAGRQDVATTSLPRGRMEPASSAVQHGAPTSSLSTTAASPKPCQSPELTRGCGCCAGTQHARKPPGAGHSPR